MRTTFEQIEQTIGTDLYRGIFSLQALILLRDSKKLQHFLRKYGLPPQIETRADAENRMILSDVDSITDSRILLGVYARSHYSRLSSKYLPSNEQLALVSRYGTETDFELFLVNYQETDWHSGLSGSARGGHIDRVRRFVSRGATDFNDALKRAALSANYEIVALMIELGATDIDEGMRGAVGGGDLSIAELMFEKLPYRSRNRTTDLCGGLHAAACTGRLEFVHLILRMVGSELSADDYDLAFGGALLNRHDEIANILKAKIGPSAESNITDLLLKLLRR